MSSFCFVQLCAGAAACILLSALPVSAQSQSENYVLQQSTLDAAGAVSDSANYRLEGSASQALTIGTSSSQAFVLQSGFWSFLGSGLVPVLLSVAKNPTDSELVDLGWSGNDPPYEIFGSPDCSGIFNSLLATTTSNSYVDTAPPALGLTCYSVLATAPGPAPPAP